jgi:hypothetical protein
MLLICLLFVTFLCADTSAPFHASHYRDALRAQFPSLCITPATAHAFASTPRIGLIPGRLRTPHAAYASLFGSLRLAQLRNAGLDADAAEQLAPALLPMQPCADAGEEAALLDVVRFLVAQRVAPAPARSPPDARTYYEEADADMEFMHEHGINTLRCSKRTALFFERMLKWRRVFDDVADVGLLVHMQLRDAEARGQPLRDALQLSGRTFKSLALAAAQRRREALVADTLAKLAACTDDDVLRLVPHNADLCRVPALTWRLRARWDVECVAMLFAAQRTPPVGLPPLHRWSATVQLGDAPDGDGCMHGAWEMRLLDSLQDIRREGRAQLNCLRHDTRRLLQRGASFWSLQFHPAEEPGITHSAAVARHVRALRVSVHVCAAAEVVEARARSNKAPPGEARAALKAWGSSCGVSVPDSLFTTDGLADLDGYDEEEEVQAWREEVAAVAALAAHA